MYKRADVHSIPAIAKLPTRRSTVCTARFTFAICMFAIPRAQEVHFSISVELGYILKKLATYPRSASPFFRWPPTCGATISSPALSSIAILSGRSCWKPQLIDSLKRPCLVMKMQLHAQTYGAGRVEMLSVVNSHVSFCSDNALCACKFSLLNCCCL